MNSRREEVDELVDQLGGEQFPMRASSPLLAAALSLRLRLLPLGPA